MPDQQEIVERREWFIRLGRQVVLGGVGVMSAVFIARRVQGECINLDSTCLACLLKDECLLPQAEESRIATRLANRKSIQ